jgi:hypothetical protein
LEPLRFNFSVLLPFSRFLVPLRFNFPVVTTALVQRAIHTRCVNALLRV